MADGHAVGVERRPRGSQPEAEMAVVQLFGDWAVFTMDDGEELLFHAGELRTVLGPDEPVGRAA